VTPEGWIRWYYDTRESFGAPALNYVDSTGRIYAKECGSKTRGKTCRSKHRHCKNDGVWVCGRCGSVWKFWDRYLLKGEVSISLRPKGFDDQNARYFDVGRLLSRFYADHGHDARVFAIHAMGASEREIAERFADPHDQDRPWSRSTVHRVLADARREWVEKLRSAGIKVSGCE